MRVSRSTAAETFAANYKDLSIKIGTGAFNETPTPTPAPNPDYSTNISGGYGADTLIGD
jgi:hypothetical protein